MSMRSGKEKYDELYPMAMKMHEKGVSVKDIANELGISYSAVYHWVKGLRKPETSNVTVFMDYVKKGPVCQQEVKGKFPKHNELFLICSRRGLPIKRLFLGRKYGDFGVWYYIIGDEKKLESRIRELENKYHELKERIAKGLLGI